MNEIFLLIFFVPAACALLIFWAVWRLLRLLDLPLWLRRGCFVGIGVFQFAPVPVPVATILVGWTPHVVWLLDWQLEMYVRLLPYVALSFVLTGIAVYAIARWQLEAGTPPLTFDWTTLAFPVVTIGVVLGVYRFFIPDRSIAAEVSVPGIQARYGSLLGGVVALNALTDAGLLQREVARLQSTYAREQVFVRVSMQTPGSAGTGERFYWIKGSSPSGASCSGSHSGPQAGLMRCTWSYADSAELDVLRYQMPYEYAGEERTLTVEFDYGLLSDELKP